MTRSRRLTVQALEDRCQPVVWNSPWADPEHLTVSFAPDGTDIRGKASVLSNELRPTPTVTWQREALRAFQTWAAEANINLAVVPDTGVAFGTPGAIQGDARHGDVRLGATNLGAGMIAATTPFDLFGGWSGSVLLNTAQAFNLGGTGNKRDLYTVLLQEAGHVFGIGNSIDPTSVMFEYYRGPRTGLNARDRADIRTLYGARTPDALEGRQGNDTVDTAAALPFATPSRVARAQRSAGRRADPVATADLTTANDVDVYSVRVPNGARSFAAALRTSGVSLLTARLTVLDAAGTVVGSAVATDPTAGDLTVAVADAAPGATYFVRVERAADDVFGIGAYRLAVGPAATQATALPGPDAGRGRSGKPGTLGDPKESSDRRWDFTTRATLKKSRHTATYKFQVPKGAPDTLVVAAWALRPGGLSPKVTVTDRTGRPLPVEVLTDAAGAYTLQVRDIRSSGKYTVRVAADDPKDSKNRGDYFLGADLRDQAITSERFAADTLTAGRPAGRATMTVAQTELLHFALATVTADSRVESAARLVILDKAGKVVFTLFASAGQAASGNVLLGAGEYTVIVAAGTRDGRDVLPELAFTLTGLVRNDPIGVGPVDPTGDPTVPPVPPPPVTTTTKPYTGPYTDPYRWV